MNQLHMRRRCVNLGLSSGDQGFNSLQFGDAIRRLLACSQSGETRNTNGENYSLGDDLSPPGVAG